MPDHTGTRQQIIAVDSATDSGRFGSAKDGHFGSGNQAFGVAQLQHAGDRRAPDDAPLDVLAREMCADGLQRGRAVEGHERHRGEVDDHCAAHTGGFSDRMREMLGIGRVHLTGDRDRHFLRPATTARPSRNSQLCRSHREASAV